MSGQRIAIDITSPVGWRHQAFWATKGKRTFGIVLAFSPSTLAVGGEVFGSPTAARGFAIFAGPFWIGFATLKAQHNAG